jgi:hypothetical protein
MSWRDRPEFCQSTRLNNCVTNRIALLRLALSGPQRVFLKRFTFAYSPWRKRLPPPRGYSA